MKGHKTLSVDSELDQWITKENINASELFEKALLAEKDKREGKIVENISIDEACLYTQIYSSLQILMNKQAKTYNSIYDSLMQIETEKQKMQEDHNKRLLKVQQEQVEALEDFKKGYLEQLSKLKGKPGNMINAFIDMTCPQVYKVYFKKIARDDLALKDEAGKIVLDPACKAQGYEKSFQDMGLIAKKIGSDSP